MALRILHTADWHLGVKYTSFDERASTKLKRARLNVLDDIFGLAQRENVDAVLCAGDLFDSPDPGETWWKAVLKRIQALSWDGVRRMYMLPGNHDPLLPTSVWAESHPFRQQLPDFVTVVDRVGFETSLGDNAVLYASPCLALSSSTDQALALPSREPGDERIRVAMVHGMTFDLDNHQANYPIANDAAHARGFDYLALGDTHGFRNVASEGKSPMVYPGTPEATDFGEKDPGHVAMVFIKRSRRVRITQKRVAHWTWRTESCSSIEELRRLADEDLGQTALRLTVSGYFQADDYHEAQELLDRVAGDELTDGIAGAVRIDKSEMHLDNVNIEAFFVDAPEEFQFAAKRLKEQAEGGGHDGEVAERALVKLYRAARGA